MGQNGKTGTKLGHGYVKVDAERLVEARHEAMMSQQELADAAGVSVNTVKNLERGTDSQAQRSTLKKLATALRVAPELLCVVSGEPEKPRPEAVAHESELPSEAHVPPTEVPASVTTEHAGGKRIRYWHLTAVIVLAVLGAVLVFPRSKPSLEETGKATLTTVWEGPEVDRIGDVSPDGTRVLYTRPDDGNLVIEEFATSTKVVLTDNAPRSRDGVVSRSRFSGDGKWVAYSRDFGLSRQFDVFVARTDGRDSRLIRRFGDVWAVDVRDWSADGKLLVGVETSKGREFQSIDVQTGRVDQIWRIAAKHRATALWVPGRPGFVWGADVDDGPEFIGTEVPRGVQRRPGSLPVGWSADGKTFYYLSNQTGAVALSTAHLSGLEPPAIVYRSLGDIRPLRVTRDGFYFGIATPVLEIHRVQIDSAGLPLGPVETVSKDLDCLNHRATWAPNGALAWPCVTVGRLPRLRIADPQAGVRELTIDTRGVDWIHWARGATRLVVAGDDLVMVDAETGRSRVIISGAPHEAIPEGVLTADDKKLIYRVRPLRGEPSRLMLRGVEGGEPSELLASVYRFDLSSDGSQIAFCTFDDDNEYIRILNLADSSVREIHREKRNGRINSISFGPDGRHIYYSQREQAHRVDVQTKQVEHLPLKMKGLRDLKIHPNGRWASFTAGVSERSEVRRLRLAGLR